MGGLGGLAPPLFQVLAFLQRTSRCWVLLQSAVMLLQLWLLSRES